MHLLTNGKNRCQRTVDTLYTDNGFLAIRHFGIIYIVDVYVQAVQLHKKL